MPHDLADLSYARRLEPLTSEPDSDLDYENVHIDSAVLTDVDAASCRFVESVITATVFTGGVLRYARFDDCWLRSVRWIGSSLSQSGWLNTEFVDCALSGIDAVGAQLRRVRFEGCKLESVNLRSATLRDVVFADCVLRDTDFGDGTLTRVSFPGSRLLGVSLHGATLREVDLRGATVLDLGAGVDALRGATVTTGQLMELAPAFARAAGLEVRDD